MGTNLIPSSARGFSLLLRFGRAAADVVSQHPVRYSTLADENLLLLVQSGNREALGVLFDRYARLVLSVGLRIIGDSAEAEDLVHDVFLFLLDRSSLFDPGKGTARGWLAKVTHNRALDRRKYLITRGLTDGSHDGSGPEEITSHGADNPEFSYWQSYFQRAFDDLSDDQRATLELFFYEGFTINEISMKLGKSSVNIRDYYYRGLKRLQRFTTRNGSTKYP